VGQKGISLSTVWSHPNKLVFKNFQFFRIPKYNLSECSEGLNASLSNLLVSCGRIHWRHFAVKFGASDCISGQFLSSKENFSFSQPAEESQHFWFVATLKWEPLSKLLEVRYLPDVKSPDSDFSSLYDTFAPYIFQRKAYQQARGN